MRSSRTSLIVLFAILFLFFLQVLSDFIQSIYAFGLLVTAFTPQLAAVLLLFSPLVLIFVRGVPSQRWVIGLAGVAMLGRLLEPLSDPGTRLVLSGVSVGAFMLLFALLLIPGSTRTPASGWLAAWGLLLAVLLSIFFRTAGSSLDISEVGITQLIAWALALFAARLFWTGRPAGMTATAILADAQRKTSPPAEAQKEPVPASTHQERREQSLRSLAAALGVAEEKRPPAGERQVRASTARTISLSIGLASVLILPYFAFVSPTVISRWTGYSYAGIVAVLVFAWLMLALLVEFWASMTRLSRKALLSWNALFVVMLVLTILPHQVAFPAGEDPFPFDPPAVSLLWQIPLYLMLLLSPVVLMDFQVFVREFLAEGPSLRQSGAAFSLAALLLLLMVFLQVFTTIYDYARPVGPLLRDRFWLVYLLAGLALGLPLLVVRRSPFATSGRESASPIPISIACSVGLLILLALFYTGTRQPSVATTGQLQVMTYNIQQGFDKVGNQSLPSQLAAIQHVQPDILGLEESDTARIANGNADAVRYFANHLGMYSYYGPPTTVGTFGVALLSKYPIQRAWMFYMYSVGEQTACIEAVITANGKTYNIFVTHLGNNGPMVQLVDVLNRVGGLPNVILMGDFNFDPSSPQYALATQTLADAWLLHWPGGYQLSGPRAEGRIDQIFVSPDMQITDAGYVPDPSSDHPYLYAVMR